MPASTAASAAELDDESVIEEDEQIAAFSENQSDVLSPEWEPMLFNRNKRRTEYALVSDQGKKVLHARAANAASGLMQQLSIDPLRDSRLTWEWRISRLVESADNHDRAREDAPARIILGFDGNKDDLPFADQIMFETARAITGREIPYATLMYIRARKTPVDTVISNARTGRVKMIVVATGKDGVGEWRAFSRDIAADYERAFGEKPGRLIAVGVLTDTDNTGETVEAWYRDIQLTPSEELSDLQALDDAR
ncbi:DUF3047 domain-containing protein [Herminiimonas aquatilis]|uniref:DUF3047 domain-containing protein n=1 Tax=Herminiimonas aquatilis TaxID=345342 RepID=A0ABW2J2V0_9BURK